MKPLGNILNYIQEASTGSKMVFLVPKMFVLVGGVVVTPYGYFLVHQGCIEVLSIGCAVLLIFSIF